MSRGPRKIEFMPEFKTDPRILQTTEPLASLKLCEAYLQADSRWPWIVLVPRTAGAREIDHLAAKDRLQLLEEIVAAGAAVRAIGAAFGRPVEKLNFGALGNIVPQLHVHVIGRRADDPTWPQPAWGAPGATPYGPDDLARAKTAAVMALPTVGKAG
jgi:diadenosine tetraphosphate (Ap4A) HIT family hydrolase